MSSRVLVAIRVEVPPEQAFDAFVNRIGAWWRPNGLFRTAPFGAGTLAFEGGARGALVERSPDGQTWTLGRVLEWQPPHRLVFSWQQPDFPADLTTEVEVRFDAAGSASTRVSVEHRGFTRVPPESKARHGFPDSALQMRLAEWWRDLLGNLARACVAGERRDG
ncbi:MAG TPA: SRPBCC family protein [Pseudomonadales bacterium]